MGMLRRRWALLASLVRPPTLAQITLAALAITCCLIGLLYFQLSEASKNALDKSASLLVELKQTQDRVRSDVRSFFESGESLLKEIDDEGMTELLKAPDSELLVFLEDKMQESPHFSEFTFTWPDGQVSVKREPTGGLRGERKDGPESAAHRTYSTLAMPRLRGREIWSDLYFSNDLDKGLSEQQVVMSVQKAIWRDGQLIGVAKVALTADRLNDVKKLNSASGWLFLSDTDGGLLTQVSDGLELVEGEDSIRYSATQAPLPVQRALRLLRGSQEEDEEGDLLTRVNLDGEKYIVSFTPLKGSQDWLVGTVWTESYFLTALKENQNRTLLVSALVLTAIFALFVGTLRRINRDLYRLVEACQGMTELDFSASHESYSLRETARLSDSLEGAKATLRAASKYAPLDLIRKLFSQDLAPELGGETREVTIMFTDVADFTSVSEKLSTNELAQALANYLAQMSAGILGHDGAILERVGDALLAVWNAPSTIENQSLKACLAALACIENTRENSWRTRIGIHRDEVMVGHFGSEKRMNYGVLGDGVNLASRVEGLNKHYGTSILATASVVEACGDNLVFRAVDRVVVKGREKSIELFELLGERGAAFPESHLNLKTSYEEALRLYRESRFEEASKLWSRLSECDPVSTVMCERAKQFAGNPPDKNWDGVFRASFK